MGKTVYGFRDVVYSKITENSDGSFTYGEVKSFLQQGVGGKNIQLSPDGNLEQYYADDMVWEEAEENNGYTGSFTLTDLSDDFLKEIMNWEEDANGVLFENADKKPNKFALGFRVSGNKVARKTWYYNCSCGRTNDDHATNETNKTYAEPQVELRARPKPDTRLVKGRIELNSDNENLFNSFFDSVYERQSPSI